MIVNLTKRVRRILIAICVLVFIGIGFYNLQKEKLEEMSNMLDSIDSNKYKIDVVFEDETKRLICNQTVEYINKTGENLKEVNFHIYPNAYSKKEYAPFEQGDMNRAYPNGYNEGYIDVENVVLEGREINFEIRGEKKDILTVYLDKEILENEVASIEIKYDVKIPNSKGRFGYGDNTINVTNWFPIACVYDEKGWNLNSYGEIGDPFYSDISDFDVKMLIPRKYKIGTTGEIEKEKSSEEETLYEIEAENVRDFAFILSDKFIVESDSYKGIAINTYNLNEDMAKKALEISKDSIEIFSELFGKYPYDVYNVVASDFYIGGMEYPNMVMIDETFYSEGNEFLLEYVIAHETAHQWWYSVVGNNETTEPWIDEALTEFSTLLYFENKYGKEVYNEMIKTMDIQTKSYSVEDIFRSTTDYKNSTDYSLNVYTKGAIAFNEVREKVGDELFLKTLREYYDTFKYENVNANEFVEFWISKGIDIQKIIDEYE